MAIDVAIPEMGESISEVILIEWLKSAGEYVERDELLCVLETDKANVELPSPDAGVLQPLKGVDETLSVGDVIARLEEGEGTTAATPAVKPIAVVTEVAESAPAAEAVAALPQPYGNDTKLRRRHHTLGNMAYLRGNRRSARRSRGTRSRVRL